MSNDVKRDTLGMSPSTATSRLRKVLLFNLLKKHEENLCFRCGLAILKEEDLSVDHIKPWQGVSSELFWDLENIAFSHLKCNSAVTRWTDERRESASKNISLRHKTAKAPEGTVWCSGHKDYLLAECFHSNERNINRCASYCKECRKVRLD